MIPQNTVSLRVTPGDSYPKEDNVFESKLENVSLDSLKSQVKENQILIKVLYISVDAAMRVWISGAKTYVDPIKPGDIMRGQGIAEVVHSNSKRYKEGDIVMGYIYWQNFSIISDKQLQKIPKNYPQYQHFLGALGISGLTAYFGLFDIGQPKKGETVVVSAAAGAAGAFVVQFAKQQGCFVIGIAGSEEKCNYVKQVLGADECINYKTQKIGKSIRQISPKGVDVYYDNVGGPILDDVLLTIKDFARIVLCGGISQYNTKELYGLKNTQKLILKKAKMQGFIVLQYAKRYPEAMQYIGGLIQEKKLVIQEDFVEGLQNGSKGLQRLLLGQNKGKVIIKVQDRSNNTQISPKL